MNTRSRVRLDAILIGPVKVEGFPVSRELIGVDCLLHAITIRTMDGFGQPLHRKSVSVDKFDKAAVCGSGG